MPEPNSRTLPDGSVVTLIGTGNEMVNYLETTKGYTVIEMPDGYVEYAIQNAHGNLVPSGIRAKDGVDPTQKNLKPHLRYSKSQIALLESVFNQNTTNLKKGAGNPFPPKGKRKVVALLVQYPDLLATIPKSNFDSLMMKPNYNGTGSFRDYYLHASFNQLELEVDVYGWFMAQNNYAYYGRSSSNYITRVGQLVKGAVLAADSAGVDFTKYDNDADGVIDGIIMMHAGIGAEETSAPNANTHIWSHRYNLVYTGNNVTVDGKIADAYGIFPEKRYRGGLYPMVGIGVLTHEFGHLLDLPDLYSTNDEGEGCGNFSNMAGGPWLNNERTPCHMDAWSREALGWLKSVELTAGGTYTIAKPVADSNFAYRINTARSNEYFLLENKHKKGFDGFIPGNGLAIWHINTFYAALLSENSGNDVNTDTSSYGVGLEQADGNFQLEKGTNRGDAGDLFPGSKVNREFTPSSLPNSSLHYKMGGISQPSNISIRNIVINPDSSITFTLGNNPVASFNSIPPSGCSPLFVNFDNRSTGAVNYSWKFGNLDSSNQKNPSFTFEKSGNYEVTLIISDSANVPQDTMKTTILVSPSPLAKFSMDRLDSNEFQLTNLSTDYLYVNWRFGTNQFSNENNPKYKINGNQPVPFRLFAYHQSGCVDTAEGTMDFWPLAVNEFGSFNQISAYPNPFHQNFTISLASNRAQEIKIIVSDLQGKRVGEPKIMKVAKGQNTLPISLFDLNEGFYLIEIIGEDFNELLRLKSY